LKEQNKTKNDSPTVQEKIIENFETALTNYLTSGPASQQTTQTITKCTKQIEHYKLTKAEIMQIINLASMTEVEINLLVEECPERLTDEDVQKLISDVKATLLKR